MKPQQSTRRLEKFIVYVLGREMTEKGLARAPSDYPMSAK